jgi:cytochrome c oxidase subunit IV
VATQHSHAPGTSHHAADAGHSHAADGHGHGHGGHDDRSHVVSLKVLLGTWGTLMVLTIVTVLAVKVDFGPSYNLAIAMAIAVVKATLVVLFFMHLFYDKLFHSVILVGGVVAAALFVGFALMDSHQYQSEILWNVTASP